MGKKLKDINLQHFLENPIKYEFFLKLDSVLISVELVYNLYGGKYEKIPFNFFNYNYYAWGL